MDNIYGKFIKDSCYSNNDSMAVSLITLPKLYLKATKEDNKFVTPLLGHKVITKVMNKTNVSQYYFPVVTRESISEYYYSVYNYKGVISFMRACTASDTSLATLMLKDVKYYAGSGCIFKDDWTPILISYGKWNDASLMFPNEIVIYIHPCIYESDLPLEKGIKNNGIKAFFTESWSMYDWRSDNQLHPKIKVILLDDFSDFITKPVIPDIRFNENNINKLLSEHADDIINTLYDWK